MLLAFVCTASVAKLLKAENGGGSWKKKWYLEALEEAQLLLDVSFTRKIWSAGLFIYATLNCMFGPVLYAEWRSNVC